MIAPEAINDFIVKMKSETAHVKRNQRLYAIPKRLDGLRARQVFYYYTHDRIRHALNQANEICIEIDSIKPFSMVPVDYKNFQSSITPLIDLIDYNKIYPIMLFLDGRFIPWECIDLIVSYEKYYLFIHDLDQYLNLIVRTAETIDMVILPSNVTYAINTQDKTGTLMNIFSFNSLGEYTRDLLSATHIIYMDPKEINLQVIENPESLFEFALNYDKQLFPENFISFTNNLYDDSIEFKILGTFAKITSDNYNPFINPLEETVDNIIEQSDQSDVTMEAEEISDNDNIIDIVTSTGSISSSGMFDAISKIPNFNSITITSGDKSAIYTIGGDLEAFKSAVDAMIPKTVEEDQVSMSMIINTLVQGESGETTDTNGTNRYIWLVFSNPSDTIVTSPINNLTQVDYEAVKDDIKAFLNDEATAPEYIKTLVEDFQFTADREKLYNENRKAIIKYILQYRQDLYAELYELGLNYFTIEVDYNWIVAHAIDGGYLTLGRKSSNGYDYYMIVFVNGELYEYYRHSYYKANKFLCPIMNILEGDKIEIMFFKNAQEYAIVNTFNKGEYLPLHEDYYNTRAKFFSKETDDDYFVFPEDGNQHFPVNFKLERDAASGDYTVVFPSDFYYGKEVTVAPDNTFRYFGYYLDENDLPNYKVSLGTKFNNCDDYHRYLIFKNGRRLTSDYYRMTIPCRTTTPFYAFDIYLAVPLAPGDRLDVFYLPTKIVDLEFDTVTLPTDGYVTIDKSILPYILDEKIYTFWVNGKKIANSDIKVVNSNSFQVLTNTGSTVDFKITMMGDPINEIEDIRKIIEADDIKWDKAISQTDYTKVLNLTKPTIKEDEENIYSGAVPIISIMWELIREHYVANPYVDIPGAFVYDYRDIDDSVIIDTTDSGYEVIDAANANPERMDNLDINRYYP